MCNYAAVIISSEVFVKESLGNDNYNTANGSCHCHFNLSGHLYFTVNICITILIPLAVSLFYKGHELRY